MEDQLLPCPFCGGEAKRFTIDDSDEVANVGGDVICCEACGASSAVEFGEKETLVERWNRRAPMPPVFDGDAAEQAEFGCQCDILHPVEAPTDEVTRLRAELDSMCQALHAERDMVLAVRADYAKLVQQSINQQTQIVALEKQALRDRMLADDAQNDAIMWQFSMLNGDHDGQPLLVRIWRQRREATSCAKKAEAERDAIRALLASVKITGPNIDGEYWLHFKGDKGHGAGINLGPVRGVIAGGLMTQWETRRRTALAKEPS